MCLKVFTSTSFTGSVCPKRVDKSQALGCAVSRLSSTMGMMTTVPGSLLSVSIT